MALPFEIEWNCFLLLASFSRRKNFTSSTISTNVYSEIDCNRNDTYNFNFSQNPRDDFSNSFEYNGIGLSVDLNSCNMDTVNNLDNQIISAGE